MIVGSIQGLIEVEVNFQTQRQRVGLPRVTVTIRTALKSSHTIFFNLQYFQPEKAFAVLGVSLCTCIVGTCGSVSVYLQHCDL